MTKQNKLFKNIIILVGGTAFAQLIAFLTIPIITRIFGPEAYGVLGVFKAVVAIFVPIAALTFPIAIVLPKNKKVAKRIVTLSLYVTVIVSIVILIILLLFYQYIISVFNIEELGLFIFLLPIVTLMGGIAQVLEQWSIRKTDFKKIARATAYQAIIVNGGIILLGLISPSAKVLISMESLKSLIKSFLIAYKDIRLNSIIKIMTFNLRSLIITSKKFKDFPIYRAPQVLSNSIGQNIPILLLTAWFGPIIAGFYTLSRTVLGVPSQLIGKSIGDVLYPHISKSHNENKNITNILIKYTFYLAMIGIVPFGTIFILGPPIFSIVFGEQWTEAGEVARWISLWSYCLFINIPSIKTLPVISAQAFHLKFTILMFIISTLSMVIGYLITNDELIVIQAVSISSAILNIILIALTIRITSKYSKGI